MAKPNNHVDWHKLDNTGKIYPLTRSERKTSLYRLTAVLSQEVDPSRIKEALSEILPRYPYFQVVLKPGLFWHYFERTDKIPPVQKDWYYPCTRHDKHWAVAPIHIYYEANRLSVEISHALTDGFGGLVFLKALLHSYLGENIKKAPGSIIHSTPEEQEWEDAYSKYFDPSVPPSKRGPKAFHLPWPLVSTGVYYSTTGIIPLKGILEMAKKDGVSLTQWLTARYIAVLAEMIQDNHWKPEPIVLNVPVDLRRLYPSNTLRNFFVTLTPQLDTRLGHFSFPEILAHVKSFMGIQVDRRYISQQFKRNVNFERNMGIRVIPLIIKRLFFPIFYYILGERQYSGGFSNLGSLVLPPEDAEKVKEVHILVPPSPGTLIKAGCISYGENLFITFGSLTETRDLEQRFFSELRKDGLSVRMDVNY